jgi:formylglycine-generating enzyme required for sulfatase activity
MAIIWQTGQLIKNGRFKILKGLGSGGFGITYQVQEVQTGTLFALKVLNQEQQDKPDFSVRQENFLNEALKLKGFDTHPNIVKALEVMEEDGLWGMLMEWIDGEDLSIYVDRKPLAEPEALYYIEQIGSALAYVHSKGTLHRDVKPSNILLERSMQSGNTRRPVLIDFGLARGFLDGKSLDASNIGTLAYAPIEQYDPSFQGAYRRVKIGRYTDVYALAATLYNLLTDRLPVPACGRIGKDSLPTPKSFNSQISDQVNDAIMWGMQMIASERPPTIEAFLNVLKTSQAKAKRKLSNKKSDRRTIIIWILGLSGLSITALMKGLDKSTDSTNKGIHGAEPRKKIPLQTIQFKTVNLDNSGEIIARPSKSAEIYKEDLGNGEVLAMLKIPSGDFMMGASNNEMESESHERPQHRVNISEFYMGQTLITQSQYQAIMGKNPSRFKGRDRPVENVDWKEAQEFCQRLSEKSKVIYTLPSESRWEYACRARSITPFTFGETITIDTANYSGGYAYGNAPKGVYRKETTIVATFPPNAFGLYDMHGNVWEWCEDTWHENYQSAPTDGSAWIGENRDRVLRGGAWYLKPRFCRSASRGKWSKDVKGNNFGFRVSFTLD